MIALSDYLDYLNAEVVTARRRADLLAVETARAYAAHEYLKYFRAPRFVMPSVRMEIPIRISELDQETKYVFAFTPAYFLSEFNRGIQRLPPQRELLRIRPFGTEITEERTFRGLVAELEATEQDFVRSVDAALDPARVRKVFEVVFERVILPANSSLKILSEEISIIFFDALRKQFRPSRTHIRNLLVTPESDSGSSKSGDLLVKLTVEMEASGVRIRKLEGPNGGEEIILDD